MKKTIIIFSVLTLFLYINSRSQEKWSVDPRMTAKTPAGIYVPLPNGTLNYVNPDSKIKYYYFNNNILAINPDFRVYPSTNQQNEVILVRHPLNHNIMFGSANTTAGFVYSQGVYVTVNGGINWYGSDILNNITGLSLTDPGPVIDKNGNFILTTINTVNNRLSSFYSTNNGVNWSGLTTISNFNSDKNFAGTDDIPASPYYGRSYVVWSNFSVSNPPISFSHTTNSGAVWSSPININTSVSGHYSQGCDIRTGAGGVIYVIWAAPISSPPYTEDFIGFAKSTNGGENWIVTNNIYDINGIRGYLFPTNIRVNGFPRMDIDRSGGVRDGWIYVITAEKNLTPAGSDPDIVLHRSTDNGNTWSAGIRVNQDALNNGKFQFFPAIRVDEYGGVNVVYYDNRNCANDSAEVFISRSTDGGNTFFDFAVSNARFMPKPEPGITGGYMGDYIGVTSGNNKVFPFWMDDRTGNFQAWTTTVELGPSIIHTPLTSTEQTSGIRAVNCQINTTGSDIDPSKTKLYYSKNNPNTFTDSILMTNTGGNNWSANLNMTGAGLYRYYLKTADLLGRTTTSPFGAPVLFHSFTSGTDTVRPVIVHIPLPDQPKDNWPVKISSDVTDNFGIDSVWVRWYKNNPSNTRIFKLNYISGNLYSGVFNSVNSEVDYGDSIFYRVIAQDNSSAHNIDSTLLYKFYIMRITQTCFQKTGSPKPIRDLQYTHDTINVSINGMILDVNVKLINIQHTFDSDLDIYLFKGSDSCMLSTDNGGSGDNYVNCILDDSAATSITNAYAPMTGRWIPETPLNVFNNKNASGLWILRIFDDAEQDTGSVVDWCVEITYQSSVGIKEKVTVFNNYYLGQNYPNPFNSSTNIRFEIPPQNLYSLTTIKLYDILGREIKTLLNEIKQPGSYIINVNLEDLPSGIYFYKMSACDFTDVKRMTLIR